MGGTAGKAVTSGRRGGRRRLDGILAAVLVVACLGPVTTIVSAPPVAAADCTYAIQCSSTLSTSASTAPIGSAISITLHTDQGPGHIVRLYDDTGFSSIEPVDSGAQPPYNDTGSGGSATWRVWNVGPERVATYRARYHGSYISISPEGVPIDASVQVRWVRAGPALHSTVTASPSVALADGSSAASVTVVLTDAGGNAMLDTPVRLSDTGSAQVPQAEVRTGVGGRAVFTLTSMTAEVLPVRAEWQLPTGVWGSIVQSAQLEFVSTEQAERALSKVTASLERIPADGLSSSTITVALADRAGPLAGRQVQLQHGGTDVLVRGQGVTDAAGRTAFTVSSAVPQNETFVANDVSAPGQPTVGTTDIRFGDAPAQEHGSSVLSLTPSGTVVDAVTVPSDGTTAAAVYVQLLCNDTPSNGCTGGGIKTYDDGAGTATGAVANGRVALVPTAATSATVTQVLNPTNFMGQARFQVTNTVPETVTYNAVDVTNNVMLASVDDSTSPPQVTPLTVTIKFVGPGTPSVTTSTATASPTSVAADGVTASTITVTLRDANRIVVPGKKVTLNPSSGSATFTPGEAITNSDGVARFSTVNTRAETVSYMVKDVSDNIVLTSFPEVTFTAGAASSSASTVSASPATLPADGVSTATITVTITDVNGGPVAGRTVSLAQGGGQSTISTPSGPTNAKGVTTFTVKNNTPETVTYTATNLTDGFEVTQAPTVTFTGRPTAANSTVTANPTSVPADSIASSTVTVTLRDENTHPVAGKLVALKPAGQSKSTPVSPGSDTTNQNGEAVFSLTNGVAQTVTLSARDVTDGMDLTGTATVSFTGPPSGSASTVVADPTSVLADGFHASTITVTLKDAVGQPILGHTIKLSASSGTSSVISLAAPGSNITDAAGAARFTVTDTAGETVTYSATDTSVFPNQNLFATAQVVFAPTPAIQSISPNYGSPAGGTKVTITGLRLADATAVKFGDRAATSFSVNRKNGSLTATSPPGSGVVDVTVVTPAATTPVVPAARFRYSPEVTSLSPSSGSSSGRTKVTLRGTNLASATSVSFGSAVVTRFSRVNDTTIVLLSPAGSPGTVDVTVTSPGGTSAPLPYTYA